VSVVVLRLAAPMQSWGSSSRFARRTTNTEPTKSGVLGLVAAAHGMRRSDPLESLLRLRYAVRVDQPGQLLRDFHTAQRPHHERDGSITWKALPLSQRYYIADAVYLAVLEGEDQLVRGIDEALRRPEFPLFLGRRSCPPAGPVALGVREYDLDTALTQEPWLASRHEQRRQRSTRVRLATVRDARDSETPTELIQDSPMSFDPNHRQYAWRAVIRDQVEITNPHGVTEPHEEHDPMTALES
jgi:CRISPR system Cascade subunit CasD